MVSLFRSAGGVICRGRKCTAPVAAPIPLVLQGVGGAAVRVRTSDRVIRLRLAGVAKLRLILEQIDNKIASQYYVTGQRD